MFVCNKKETVKVVCAFVVFLCVYMLELYI